MYISVIMCIPLGYCIKKSYALAANRLGEATSSLEVWNLQPTTTLPYGAYILLKLFQM